MLLIKYVCIVFLVSEYSCATYKNVILDPLISANRLHWMQGEVLIRGKLRNGLVSDEEISGLRIGLVSYMFYLFFGCPVKWTVEVLLECSYYLINISIPLTGVSECCTFWFLNCSWKCWFLAVRYSQFTNYPLKRKDFLSSAESEVFLLAILIRDCWFSLEF